MSIIHRIFSQSSCSTLSDLNKNYSLTLSSEIEEREDKYYNCMGFAFGTYEWEDLDGFDYSEPDDDSDISNEDAKNYREEVLRDAAESLTNGTYSDFPKIREIFKEEEASTDEYVVAMRLAKDDYHFMRRFDDGTWYEKCGSCGIRECSVTVYDPVWISLFGGNYL